MEEKDIAWLEATGAQIARELGINIDEALRKPEKPKPAPETSFQTSFDREGITNIFALLLLAGAIFIVFSKFFGR